MPNETEVMLVDWFEYNCFSRCDNLRNLSMCDTGTLTCSLSVLTVRMVKQTVEKRIFVETQESNNQSTVRRAEQNSKVRSVLLF